MKSIKFEKVLSRRIMIFTFLSIFIVEIAIYGIFSYYGKMVTEKRENREIAEMIINVKKATQSSIGEIEHKLEMIELKMRVLQSTHEEIFTRQDVAKGDGAYFVHPNGALYNADNNGSSLYYNSLNGYDDNSLQRVYKTEQMDLLFKILVDSNELIQQVYFNGYDNLNRLYPFVTNLAEELGNDINVEEFIFYYLADLNNNPTKGTVWTPLYKDPAGLGWVVSCIAPIYNKQVLEGVSGIDIEIENLVNNILEIDISYPHRKLLFDDKFNLISVDGKEDKFVKVSNEEKLYFNDEISINKIESLYTDDVERWEIITIESGKYFVVPLTIKTTNWKLLVLIDYEEIYSPIESLASDVDSMLRTTNLTLIILTIFFVFLAYMVAKKIALNLVLPLQSIEKRVVRFTKERVVGASPLKIGIKEIDSVNEDIYKMMNEITESTKKIIEANEEKARNEIKMNCLHEYSYKDMLTELFNRRKMEELLDQEIDRGIRYGNTFAFLLIDIDYFKRINDDYGHNIGDIVLREIATLIGVNLRETDYLGRWGGEEFVVICQESKISRGIVVAEKIRQLVENNFFIGDIRLSVSIGVVEHRAGQEDKYTLFKRVDELLYHSKGNGRNKVSHP